MNPETRALLQKMAGIHLLLGTVELNHFAAHLVEKELLSYQSMNSILSTVGYAKTHQVQQLMESVVAQVTVTPTKFEDFVNILSADPVLQRLAEELTKTYSVLVAVYMEEQRLQSSSSQGSPDLPVHKHLPTVPKVLPPALSSPPDVHLPPDTHHPPLPNAYPPLPDAHSPPGAHPPLPDVHHNQRPTLAETISCSPSPNPVLERSIKELEEKFLKVVRAIQVDCTFLDINDIKIYLTLIPTVMKQDHISFLTKHNQDIAHASSVIEIILLLNLYWDCFNYGLLEHLVDKCGRNQTKQLMEQFAQDVKAFMKETKLADFMCIWKGREEVPPGFSQLVVRHGLDPKQTTLCQVEQFRKDFCQHYSLHQVVLIFRNVHPGSVKVVWLIQSHVAEHLCAEMKNPEVGYKVLMQYSVLEILINGVAVFVCTSGKEEVDEEKKPWTGAKTEEQVSLFVNYNSCRVNFKFFRSTLIVDALSEVAAKFKISEPHTKALLHNGHVMNEEATFGNFEGTTVVHLVNKIEVMSVRTAMVEGIQDHDKYFGFCGSCKLLTKVRPIVNHCGTGVFVLDSTAQPDYHSANPDLTGKCHACKAKCKGKVKFQCTSCGEVGVAFLRLVRKNTPGVPCMNCCKVEEQVFVFPCPNRHCLCLGCFVNYCQVMMNCDLFCTFPEVGYSIYCPAPGVQCKESPVLDPHHFCLVDNKGPFYANYKEKSCSHLDLPDTSILCHCKMEIDISSETEASPRTVPVAATQEDVAGIGWFRSLLRIFSGPVRAPPPAPPPASSRGRRRVSCRKCQTVYCCDCKMTWHEGMCQEVTEAMKEQEKFKIEAVNAQKGVWPKDM